MTMIILFDDNTNKLSIYMIVVIVITWNLKNYLIIK